MTMNNDVLFNKGEIEKIEDEVKKCDEKVGMIGPCRGTIPIMQFNAYRKKCYDDIGGFDERFYPCCGEDQDIFIRLAQGGWKYKRIKVDYQHVEGGHHCRIEIPAEQYKKFLDKWGFPPSGNKYYEIINKVIVK